MMPRCFRRYLASGALILAAIAVLQRADAASSTNDASGCPAAGVACSEDDVCFNCTTGYDNTVYEECFIESVNNIDVSSSSTGCSFQTAALMCCQVEASEESCMDNDVYLDYWQCNTPDAGCLIDGDSCMVTEDANGSTAASTRMPSSVVFACALGLAAAVSMMT